MRNIPILALVAAVALGVAVPAVGQDSGVISYPKYGFSVVLPTPRVAMGLNLGQISGMVDCYKANNLVYVAFATDEIEPKGVSARQALAGLGPMMNEIAAKVPQMGLHTISGTTAQGIAAVGFAARVSKDMAPKTSKSAMDWATSVPAELRAMFGDEFYQAVLIAPTTETGRMIVGVGVVGPGGQSAQIDAEVGRVMKTLSIGSQPVTASGTVTTPPAPLKSLSRLKKGQIELIGTVSSIDKPGKSLIMMVSQVTSYGQSPAGLDPARQKKVFVKAVPADVKEGCKIVVVGADSGVGKPVTAESVRAIESGEGK